MTAGGNIVYVFDIKNTQHDYAQCSEFISLLEHNKDISDTEKLLRLSDVVNSISVSGCRISKNLSPNYIEEPLSSIDPSTKMVKMTEIPIKNAKHLANNDFNKKLLSVSQTGKISYHIRIHTVLEDSTRYSLINLQYLTLLMQKFESLFLDKSVTKKRLSIFIVPTSGNIFPYQEYNNTIDYNTYTCISRYLRLLSNEYCGVIYGVDKRENEPIVRALDFKRININEHYDHFPLIPTKAESYNELFEESINEDALDDLFALQARHRFRKANDLDPNVALRDFVAETSFRRLCITLDSIGEKQSLLSEIKNEIKNRCLEDSSDLPNWITFALFSFLLRFERKNNKTIYISAIRQAITLADDLGSGLRQLVQNAIQHSEKHACVFSFYLNMMENTEVDIFNIPIYKEIEDAFNEYSPAIKPMVLEVQLADLNDKQTIVESFIENLKWEFNKSLETDCLTSLDGYTSLINSSNNEKIAIRNFFHIYEGKDPKDKWYNFRRSDSSAHIGLALFAQTARRCKAIVRVVSSTKLRPELNEFFYHAYGKKKYNNNEVTFNFRDSMPLIIPGTQFLLTIPIIPISDSYTNSLAQLNNVSKFNEDYRSFARFIDFSAKLLIIDDLIFEAVSKTKSFDIVTYCDKFLLQQIWTEFWIKLFNECIEDHNSKSICCIDLKNDIFSEYLASSDSIEVLLKGLFNSFSMIQKKEPVYFAMINATNRFLKVLKRVCVSLALKCFPGNIQLFISAESHDRQIHLLGDTFEQAVQNAYVLSLEHGMGVLNADDTELAFQLVEPFSDTAPRMVTIKRDVIPFDAIIPVNAKESKKLFDKRIEIIAEYPIDSEPYGYKLDKTHVRLGSKVHIKSFYEMSFLFYRTSIANRVAFEMLQNLKDRGKSQIDIQNDTIMFYGYASYSKAILTSLTEILKEYRSEKKEMIAFTSFQHNLQDESASEDIQTYFSFPKGFPCTAHSDNKISLKSDIKVIQVVPISSTLTTFEKMWTRFKDSVNNPSRAKLMSNYTIYWVSDKENGAEIPSSLEQKYWKSVCVRSRAIEINTLDLGDSREVNYLMRAFGEWCDPLTCNLCFPEFALNEIPLVETDPTSTVPSQQIRSLQDTPKEQINDYSSENNKRILALDGCVYYGHIVRGKNHYQYYIDTQKYFYNVKDEVQEWLKGKSKSNQQQCPSGPILKIIFSPEHNTNVGFAQYVNIYYFGGTAEIIAVNEDKEYRSNFKCEHAALIKIIRSLHEKWGDPCDTFPVEFYFADDVITTGETFNKANRLLRCLLPEEYSNLYPTNLIKKCFILVDRLSNSSKKAYVTDVEEDFLSFVHIDISNTRRQGDSCVGCKLERDAMKLFKRSSSRNIANYWAQKAIDYNPIVFDDIHKMHNYQENYAFERLVISHLAQNIIFNDNDCFTLGNAYDSILTVLFMLVGKIARNPSPMESRYRILVETLLSNNVLGKSQSINCVKIMLKLISRPFFSFDFKVRLQVMTLLLVISETLLDSDLTAESIKAQIDPYIELKSFILDENRIEKTLSFVERLNVLLKKDKDKTLRLRFFQECIMESLADLRSTYLLRKNTIKKIYRFVNENSVKSPCLKFREEKACRNRPMKERCNGNITACLWRCYAVFIHRVIDCSGDETRALWLEYMLLNGNEYIKTSISSQKPTDFLPDFLYNTLVPSANEKEVGYFQSFCEEIFLQNTRLLFDGLEKSTLKSGDDSYIMERWKESRKLNQLWMPQSTFLPSWPSDEEIDLFKHFPSSQEFHEAMQDANKNNKFDVKLRYDELLTKISKMIQKKYDIAESHISIALLTHSDISAKSLDMMHLNLVTSVIYNSGAEEARCKYIIKERVREAINRKNKTSHLMDYGYHIEYANDKIDSDQYLKSEKDEKDSNHRKPYFILFFDNPNCEANTMLGRELSPIAPVFIYLSILVKEAGKRRFVPWLIMRDLFTYRNRLLRFLEDDFNGDIMTKYAHTVGQKNILEHEKAASHATTGDDLITLEVFGQNATESNGFKYDCLKKEDMSTWLLLRSYVNGQIAKLFNRSFRDSNGDDNDVNYNSVPRLYISDVNADSNNVFKRKLIKFSDLKLQKDQRFKLMSEIAKIQILLEPDTEFIGSNTGGKKLYYNCEYFNCLLFDIFLTSIKYKSDRADFLLRVNQFLGIEKRLKSNAELPQYDNLSMQDLLLKERCNIFVVETGGIEGDDFNYCVILNAVNPMANHIMSDWEYRNTEIRRRLSDPLDFADGHMSLLTIYRYVEGLRKKRLTMGSNISFKYCSSEHLADKYKDEKWFNQFETVLHNHELWFETKLPILKRRNGDEKSMLD